MKSPFLPSLLLIAATALAGCGGKSGDSAATSAATASGPGSKYDSGPRAAEEPLDQALAETGEQLFKDKGCSACHTFGRKLTGPDLAGVSQRRTARWIERQILHPDLMTKEDPTAKKLLAEFMLQMPNQGLNPGEARAIVEYFKHQDHEAAGSPE